MPHTHEEFLHAASRRLADHPFQLPGFASTADYFTRLARKERQDEERRQRLLEVAGFYRSLAGIIPGMPKGFTNNGSGLAVTRAQRWRARAEECRTLVDCLTDRVCRAELKELAENYDRMAAAAE